MIHLRRVFSSRGELYKDMGKIEESFDRIFNIFYVKKSSDELKYTLQYTIIAI